MAVVIGKDMNKVTGHVKLFYNDENTITECRLMEEIDGHFQN